MNYYPHNIGDYDSHTAHLSWLEDCAYRRMLSLYYRTEKPLPADVRSIQRYVRCTNRHEQHAVVTVLEEFFELRDDGWHHGRCDEEIAKASEKREVARENGNRGGRPRKPTGLSLGSSQETQPVISGFDSGNPNVTQTKAPNPNPNPNPIPDSYSESLSQPSDRSLSEVRNASARANETPADVPRGTLPPNVRACILLREAGHAAGNPQHAGLLAALDAGVTPESIRDTANEFPLKPFGYWLHTALGRLHEARRLALIPPAPDAKRWEPPDEEEPVRVQA